MNLYIVTTGLPGPDPATCGFVEVEDETGASVGPSTTGADWHPVPDTNLYRLGPFAPVASRTAVDRAPSRATAAEEIVRALAAATPMQTHEDGCSLCSSWETVAALHEHDCPWRLAVEWVAREEV